MKTKKPMGMFARTKRMDDGGVTPKTPWLDQYGNTIAGAAGIVGTGIDALSPTDAYGVRSNTAAAGSGLLTGAAAGFKTAGVIGAGIGAVVGGISGLLGNKAANRRKQSAIAEKTRLELGQTEQIGEEKLAANPNLKYGNPDASFYRFGGTMKGGGPTPPRQTKPIAAVQTKPRLMPNIADVPGRQISRLKNGGAIKPPEYNLQKFKRFKPIKMEDGGGIHIKKSHEGRFTAYKERTGKTTEEALHSSDPHVRQMANFARNSKSWNKKAIGGTIEPLSSEDGKVVGRSHDTGGVKFPSAGVELEGGETVNGGFVFSKKLGFAQQAEKIGRQLGKAEQRPDDARNKATIAALQNKTERLKVHQEAVKAAAGIPNDLQKKDTGGPIKPGTPMKLRIPATTIDFNNLKTPASDDFITKNAAWLGAPNGTSNLPGGGTITNLRASSDKMNGTASIFYPARNQARGKAIETIPHRSFKHGGKIKQTSNAGGAFADYKGEQIYGMGGKVKKMDIGGSADPDEGVTIYGKRPVRAVAGTPVFPAVQLNTPGTLPAINLRKNDTLAPLPVSSTGTNNMQLPITQTASSSQSGSGTKGNSFMDTAGDVVDKVTPFLSNFYNATQKLPLPPKPILNPELTPSLVDYSASRAEAVRQNRGANAAARKNLNTGAAVSATVASNLAAQTRAVSQINEAESSANAGIKNQMAAENAQIRAGNTAQLNRYNEELTSRQLKSQQLKNENMANIEEKIQGMNRDKKLFNLDEQKAMLGWLQNNDSGAGYDAVRDIFSKHLSPESLKKLDAEVAKQKKERAEDRADTIKSTSMMQSYLKNRKIQPGTIYDTLGNNVSSVNTAKEEQADAKTWRKGK